MYHAEATALSHWLAQATVSEVTWFKVRKQLWEGIKAIIRVGVAREDSIQISATHFNTIKSVLLSRSQNLDDNKLLAFETSIQQLLELVGNELEDEDDNEPKGEKGGHRGKEEKQG